MLYEPYSCEFAVVVDSSSVVLVVSYSVVTVGEVAVLEEVTLELGSAWRFARITLSLSGTCHGT